MIDIRDRYNQLCETRGDMTAYDKLFIPPLVADALLRDKDGIVFFDEIDETDPMIARFRDSEFIQRIVDVCEMNTIPGAYDFIVEWAPRIRIFTCIQEIEKLSDFILSIFEGLLGRQGALYLESLPAYKPHAHRTETFGG